MPSEGAAAAALAFRQAIERSGLSRVEVAERLGVTPNIVSGFRTGRETPGMEIAGRIAAEFGGKLADYLDLPHPQDWELRHYRLATGQSQTAVAHQLGVDQTVISNWENARVRPADVMIEQLASLYGVSADTLRFVIDRAHTDPMACLLAVATAMESVARHAATLAAADTNAERRRRTQDIVRSNVIRTLHAVEEATRAVHPSGHDKTHDLITRLATIIAETS